MLISRTFQCSSDHFVQISIFFFGLIAVVSLSIIISVLTVVPVFNSTPLTYSQPKSVPYLYFYNSRFSYNYTMVVFLLGNFLQIYIFYTLFHDSIADTLSCMLPSIVPCHATLLSFLLVHPAPKATSVLEWNFSRGMVLSISSYFSQYYTNSESKTRMV